MNEDNLPEYVKVLRKWWKESPSSGNRGDSNG